MFIENIDRMGQMEVDVMDIGDPQGSLRMRNRLERRKLSPLRGDGSWHDDEHDPGGPSFRANRTPVCLPFPLSCTSGFGMLQSGQHQGTPGMPCRCASNSLPSGGMGHGMTMSVIQEGLPSEQTGLRFASFSFN